MASSLSYTARIREAQRLYELKAHVDATRLCVEILNTNPRDRTALAIMILMALREHRIEDAQALARKYANAYPKDQWLPYTVGTYLSKNGKAADAIVMYERFLKREPNCQIVIIGLAEALEHVGEVNRARELLGPIIESGDEPGDAAVLHAKMELDAKRLDSAIAAAQRHVNHPQASPALRRELWFIVGLAHERAGRIDDAFAAYQNAHKAEPRQFDQARYRAHIDEIIATFSSKMLKRAFRPQHSTRLPVFIVGRPRSGTTLIERVIASHPQARAAGELVHLVFMTREMNLRIGSSRPYPPCAADMDQQDIDDLSRSYLDRMASIDPSALRITDKQLRNAEFLGLISMLFPEAAIIDLRRNPVDNCLACYTANLSEVHAYADDWSSLAFVHRQHERLMEHWHGVIQQPILRLDYEEFIDNQEQTTRTLIDFCGLDWNDQCLRYHENTGQQATATITPSYQQVRQPLYRTSVGRAEKFKAYLQPLYDALSAD